MNYIISEAFEQLKSLEEDSQNKKAQAISNFISRRSSELNSEKGAQIASNEFSFAGMSNEEAVRKMNDLGEGHYEMYQEEIPGNFWTNGAPVIKKYIKKVEYKDKYLNTLDEDRFSYDKEQEFTSKSTAHGNGVANK